MSYIFNTYRFIKPDAYNSFTFQSDQKFKIPMGQYALSFHSDVPVFAVFGRLDVRQVNMACYSVQGYNY